MAGCPATGPCLVVEHLGMGSWLYAVLVRWRFAAAYYVTEGWLVRRLRLAPTLARLARLTQLRYEDFPGSYYDVQREAVLRVNDAFHREHGQGNPLRALLLAYKDHPLLDVALRKALINYYTLARVKTWAFLDELRRRHDQVVLVPRDNLPFGRYLAAPWRSASAGCNVPSAVRAINRLRELAARLILVPAILVMVGELVGRRGLQRAPLNPAMWPFAFDIFAEGIVWERPRHDTFLYDGRVFAPQNILHVVRGRLKDEATRRFFEANGHPYVEFGRVPIPGRLFLARMLGAAVMGALRRAPQVLIGPHAAQDYLVPVLAVLRTVMEHEALFARYHIGVFVARDEYSVDSVVRTALIREHGGKTVGFTHGDDTYASRSNQYIAMDYLCYPGDYHHDILHPGNACSGTAVNIGAGIYGLDDTFRFMQTGWVPPKYGHLVGRYRVVGAFPTSYTIDFAITREHLLSFYRTVVALEDMYDDVFVIICPKYKGLETRDPGIRDLLSRCRGRVVVDEDVSPYELIPLCDLMICMASTTIGLEGLTAGKRVLYLEETGFRDHPYRRYDHRLVAWTPDELLRSVKWVLDEGGYVPPEAFDRIRSYHGLRFDGQVVERLRAVARRALEETPFGPAEGSRG